MIDTNAILMGIDEDNELIIATFKDGEWKGEGYRELCTEEHGEDEARNTLSSSDYWEELGYIKDFPNILINHIDFEAVADEVINSDGWQMINGEWYEIGEYEGESIYASWGCGWNAHKNAFKTLFITDEELKAIQNNKPIDIKQDRNAILKRLIDELDFDFNRSIY